MDHEIELLECSECSWEGQEKECAKDKDRTCRCPKCGSILIIYEDWDFDF